MTPAKPTGHRRRCTDRAVAGDAARDADLLARLRAGESSAYDELVRANTGRLLVVTRRILNSEEDARDAVQDAFVSAFRNIQQFEGGSLLSTWLHRIAVNAALMKLRTRKRKPERSIEELLPSFLEDGHHAENFQDWNQPTDRAMMRAETRAVVRQCIGELPENYRTVLILRDIEELDTDETAERLGMTPNAVKIRLHRARQALRSCSTPISGANDRDLPRVYRFHDGLHRGRAAGRITRAFRAALVALPEVPEVLRALQDHDSAGKSVFESPDDELPESVPEDLIQAIMAAKPK